MTRLEAAQKRLEAALARIEAARSRAAEGQDDDSATVRELARVREDYTALKAATDDVAGRLDDTIERLRRLLGDAAE